MLVVKVADQDRGRVSGDARLPVAAKEGMYTTLLMSTGLTFGTISALFGLSHGIVDQAQYSALVAAVIASAVVPTLIANACFMPRHLLPGARGAESGAVAQHGRGSAGQERLTMYRKILVGYDGSAPGRKAFDAALDLAAKHGAELHVLTVARPPEIGDDVETEAVIENSRRYHHGLLASCDPRSPRRA